MDGCQLSKNRGSLLDIPHDVRKSPSNHHFDGDLSLLQTMADLETSVLIQVCQQVHDSRVKELLKKFWLYKRIERTYKITKTQNGISLTKMVLVYGIQWMGYIWPKMGIQSPNQWIGLRGNIYRKPWRLPANYSGVLWVFSSKSGTSVACLGFFAPRNQKAPKLPK